MKLGGAQLQQILSALISAYPTVSALDRMASFGLNENLQAIAGSGNLTDVGFELIRWAQAQGRLEELVREAYEQNPGNRDLQAVAGWFLPAPTPTPEAGPTPVGGVTATPDRVTIRNALRDRFSAEELRALCFDLGIDYEVLPGETKPAKAQQLVEYMERRGQTDRLVAAIRSARGPVI
jgi:predicted DsbA family dithiol-disulfide isomerase